MKQQQDRREKHREDGATDSLDVYMTQSIVDSELDRAKKQYAELRKELVKYEQILQIATPAIDHENPLRLVSAAAQNPSDTAKGTTTNIEAEGRESRASSLSVPGPDESIVSHKSPPVVVGFDTDTASKRMVPVNSEPKRSPAPKPMKGPTLPESNPKRASVSSQRQGDKYASDTLEGGDKIWEPPKGQTGDGRTALNDKLGY